MLLILHFMFIIVIFIYVIELNMLFYELDYQVWTFHQEWTFEEPCSEVVGS